MYSDNMNDIITVLMASYLLFIPLGIPRDESSIEASDRQKTSIEGPLSVSRAPHR